MQLRRFLDTATSYPDAAVFSMRFLLWTQPTARQLLRSPLKSTLQANEPFDNKYLKYDKCLNLIELREFVICRTFHEKADARQPTAAVLKRRVSV
jgi:hypothetical protein